MGLLKKNKKKKPMRMSGASTTQQSNLRPSQIEMTVLQPELLGR